MKTGFAQSKRSEAIKHYRSAIEDAKSGGIPAGERLRRSFEIVAALYEVGEYRAGWADISDVLTGFVAIYGDRSQHQSPVALYWANWAIKLGRIEEVEDFLSRHKSNIETLSAASQQATFIEWKLTEARLLIEKEKYVEVEKLVQGIDLGSLDLDQVMSIDVLKAENLLMKRMPLDALRVLYSEKWISEVSDKKKPTSKWAVYRYWIEGIALSEIGDNKRASDVLSLAKTLSGKTFGLDHPSTSKIILAKSFADIKIDSNNRNSIYTSEIDKALESLKNSFPPDSKSVSDAEKIVKIVRDPSSEESAEALENLKSKVPFL